MALLDTEALMMPGDFDGFDLLADAIRQRPRWMSEAACAGQPRERWFPSLGKAGRRERKNGAAALAVCARCSVREPCLAYALDNALVGIWGATSTAERRAMRQAVA